MVTTVFSQQPPIETGVSQTLAKWRSSNYSDVRYKLNITLEKGAPLMKGEMEIRVTLTDEGAKNPLILDWRTTQFANDKAKPYANIVAVNDAMDFRSQENKEHLLIPNGYLKKGENVIGEYIRVNGVYFKVVGLTYITAGGNEGRDQAQQIYIPFSTFQNAFNYGDVVGWFAIKSKEGIPAEVSEEKVISILNPSPRRFHAGAEKKRIAGVGGKYEKQIRLWASLYPRSHYI